MMQNRTRRLGGWEISRRTAWLNFIKIGLLMVQTALFMAVWFCFYQKNMLHPYYYWGNWVVGAVFTVLFLLFARLYGGLHINTARASEIAYSLMIASVFTDFVMYCIICLLSYRLVSPLPLLLCWGCGLAASMLWARIAVRIHDRLFPPSRTCIVYDNEDAFAAMETVKELSWKFDVQSTVNIAQGMDRVFRAIERSEAVILCGLRSSDRNTVLKLCVSRDIQTYIRPKIGDILVSGATRIHLGNLPFLYYTRNNRSYWYRIAKRMIDVGISALALVLCSPVMLLTALAIHLCDGGPVLYRQTRLTEDGRTFSILKFRSMRMDAEKDGVARLAREDDDRITPVGEVIRRYRIDELPQFFNILRGEMSLVGPRPERPEIAAQYEAEMPEFRLRLQAKAGLTGYAQVYGRYNTDPYDKLEMDLMYIAKPSILQDISLLFATVKVLFLSGSTQGVKAEQTTASARDPEHSSLRVVHRALARENSGKEK